jgi:hypothetical protein
MMLEPGQTVQFRDGKRRLLGRVLVEHSSEDLISGTFEPSPEYSAVAGLFRRFEEAADHQARAVVDEIDAAIAALGLSLSRPDASERLAIHDVQIWSDGGFSCRPGAAAGDPVNGAAAGQSEARRRPS